MFCQILEIPGTLVNRSFSLDFTVGIFYMVQLICYTFILFSIFLTLYFQKERRKMKLSFFIVPSTIFVLPHTRNSQARGD